MVPLSDTLRPVIMRRSIWAEARRYLGLEALAKARLTLIDNTKEEPDTSQPD